MRAALDDAAVIQADDHVGVAHGAQAMSDHKRGASVHERIHAALHDGLGARVDGGRGLVQDHDGRVGHGGARNAHELALALGELRAVVGEHGVVAVRQVLDERVGARQLGGLDALIVRGIQTAVADVVHHRAGEQVDVLQHHSQRTTQVVLVDLVHVDAVVADLAVGDVVKAVDQVGDGGLARAGRTHKGHLLARLGVHAHVVQDLVIGRVAKVNVFHDHIALERHVLDLAG